MYLLIELLDYFGIIVFAVSGALAAARARMDVVGFALLGIVTGIGGGSVRDLLLGRLPVFWIEQPQYIVLCILAAVVTFFSVPLIASVMWIDRISVAPSAIACSYTSTKSPGDGWLVEMVG